jgi:sugar phosphate isomerase/epimerase
LLATAGLLVGRAAASPATVTDFSLNVFSKHLQWLNYPELAKVAAELGFEGIDLTVRPGGHVEPARVAEELPRAVEAIRQQGLQVPLITTSITRADESFAEDILRTASALRIPFYRMGWIAYNPGLGIEQNLAEITARLKGLQTLNQRYSIHGGYQNHQGANFGSAVWDLWTVLKELDARWVGAQYDVLHATVEGANSWVVDFRLIHPYIRTFDLKDFRWTQTGKGMQPQVVPLGEGQVDYPRFWALVKELGPRGPLSLHFEYPLGGAENGARSLSVSPEIVKKAMKKDLETLKGWLQQAGLR